MLAFSSTSSTFKVTMTNLLSLPLELRFHIYSDTLSRHADLSLTDQLTVISSTWEFSFPSSLLLANKQIHAEAKCIFYGKNTWIMTASMHRTPNALPPLAAIPYVRTARLTFHLITYRVPENAIQNCVDDSCRMLRKIDNLCTLQIECTEDRLLLNRPVASVPDYSYPLDNLAAITSYLERRPEMRHSMNECLWGQLDSDQELMSRLLQPLLGLPGTCKLQKGDICVDRRDVMRARIRERAFSNCLDAVMALRLSPLEGL